ncbi:uncharacterized protein ELE39_003444 [Cryptosporidium sp. chipmunk genotype I]|uniref:uncharacterized protein n=1 Tax=Cryptosporidium sp. chipmunk genotype I TaxID=1280935 RepID=UPI00351A3F68|nr:hypothetical protein ELE39_003444 [Cryptosporidium sp. chipmunk genotype I]
MTLDCDKNRILIAPAPNWFCISALSLEEKKGFYVYSTKNSLILATTLENRILGSVYCGVKSKPIGVSIFTSSDLSEETVLIVSTHLDYKIRFWKIIDGNYVGKEVLEDSLCNEIMLKSEQRKSTNMAFDELRISLLSDSASCNNQANVVYHNNGQIFVGDTTGEILKIAISDLKDRNKPESLLKRFHPIKEEITSISGMLDRQKLALGYKSGQIIIINNLNGGILQVLEDDRTLIQGSILSIVDLNSEMIISTSKGNGSLIRYCKKSENIEKIKIEETINNSIRVQGIEKEKDKDRGKNNSKIQKFQGIYWNLLVRGDKEARINRGTFFLIMNHEIVEFSLLENNEINIKRKFSISFNEKERNKDPLNSEIIFSVLSYELNTRLYLLGITKNKKVFLFNTTEWKLEWIMNTLGGWIDELVSPNGFSHIIYLLSGEGRLIGMDLLESNREFTQRVTSCYIYDRLSGLSKDEKISKISINPINPEYIFYSTSLGNLGMLYINPDNISQYSNIKIKIDMSNIQGLKRKDIFNRKVSDQKYRFLFYEKSELLDFVSESELDWLVLLKPSSFFTEDPALPLSDLQQNLHVKNFNSNNGKLFNSQIKLFNSLIFNTHRYSVILVYNYKKRKCLFAHLSPEFENGELIINLLPRSFGLRTTSEAGIKQDHIIRLRASNLALGIEYSNAVYFVAMDEKVQIDYLGENLLDSVKTNQLIVETRNDQEVVSIYIYKLVFSTLDKDQTGINSFEKMEIMYALNSNISQLEHIHGIKKPILEKVINGIIVFNNLKDFEEIYLLVTNHGNLIIVSFDKKAIKLKNVFKEKTKIHYDYIALSMIEVGSIGKFNDSENSTFVFNLAISNELNQTSIVQVKVSSSKILNKEDIFADILLIRPNTDHKGSITHKFHFKSKSIWYRDVIDFDNTYESNLRLLVGGQEQMLQLFDISKDIISRSKHKLINKNSLIFLTNKTLYQQNNQTCLKVLAILLELKLKHKLNTLKETNKDGNFFISKSIESHIIKTLNEPQYNEIMLDLILFLNHKNSSSDLIELHLEKYFENENEYETTNSNINKGLNKNLNSFIEYLYLINGQIDFDSSLFKNFLEKHSKYFDIINMSQFDDENFTRIIQNFQNTNDDYLLIKWLMYNFYMNSKYSEGFEFSDINDIDTTMRSLVIIKLDKLQLKLKSLNSLNNCNIQKNISVFIGENPNILHEYCVLNILLGRCHKAIEMYCHYSLFQCAWVISNLYLGNDHELTIKVLRDWSEYLLLNNLTLQSFKCLIASSDFEKLYDLLLERIYYISDSYLKAKSNTGLNEQDSFSQVYKLFNNFKLVGYYILISSLRNNNESTNSSNSITKFSADLVNYILVVFNRYRINNNKFMNEIYLKFNFKEIISIKNQVELLYIEEDLYLMDKTFNELEVKIMMSIHLYELIVQFSLLVFCSGSKIEISKVEEFLKEHNLVNEEDLYLVLKKLNYLPYEDQIKLSMEFGVMKDLLVLVLSCILERNINKSISKVEDIIKVLFSVLFSNNSNSNNESIFDMTFKVLSEIFLLEQELENLRSSYFTKGLSKISSEWCNLESLMEFKDLNNYKLLDREEFQSKRIVLIKFDLYILSILNRLNNENNSILNKSLDELDLENLSKFISQEQEFEEFSIKNSISFNFIFNTSSINYNFVWLYNKLTNLVSQNTSQEVNLKAKKLVLLIRKQYLNKKYV